MDVIVTMSILYIIANIVFKIDRSIGLLLGFVGFIQSLMNWQFLDFSFTLSLSFFVSLYILLNTIAIGLVASIGVVLLGVSED